MALGQATWLDLIPGARQGVSYLMGQVAKFERLPSRFTQLETTAIAVKRQAEGRGRLGEATALALALQGVGKLRDQQQRTAGKLADVLEGLRTAGIAATPVELGLLAARVATEMAALFNGTDGVERAIYAAARRVMSPSEVDQLKGGGGGGGSATFASPFMKYALFGGLLYGAILIARRRPRRAHA